MAEKNGYIKIDRNMLDWQWFKDMPTAHLFVTLLLKANYKKLKFQGEDIDEGELVTSYENLCKISGLTIQQCRTAIKHLKSTGELTVRLRPRYQVITINNYKKYQNLTGKLTGDQQATNRQLTGNQQQVNKGNKGNKGKEWNNGRSAPGSPDGEIPKRYRDMFKTYEEYLAWRNQ
jgi:hypothetical protein